MKKIILYLIVLSSLSFLSYANEAPNETMKEAVRAYADKLVKDELNILNKQQYDQVTKVKETKKLIVENLDLDWMAKYTLGGFRKTLLPEQINNFTRVYSKYVSKTYSDLVKDYHGQQPEIASIEFNSEGKYTVPMKIGTVNVKYIVHKTPKGYKVADIITEGVSLISSQQAEFTNIISGQGYDALIAELEKKS